MRKAKPNNYIVRFGLKRKPTQGPKGKSQLKAQND